MSLTIILQTGIITRFYNAYERTSFLFSGEIYLYGVEKGSWVTFSQAIDQNSLCLSFSLGLFVALCLCLSVSMSLSLSPSVSVCLSVCLSACLSLFLSFLALKSFTLLFCYLDSRMYLNYCYIFLYFLLVCT